MSQRKPSLKAGKPKPASRVKIARRRGGDSCYADLFEKAAGLAKDHVLPVPVPKDTDSRKFVQRLRVAIWRWDGSPKRGRRLVARRLEDDSVVLMWVKP